MSEIKLTLNDPANFVLQLRHAAEMLDVCEPLDAIADSIEEQVKPTIEEPTEWGSLVRASFPNSDGERYLLAYVPNPYESDPDKSQGFPWYSERDDWCTWGDLRDVQVLRIGVGEAEHADVAPEETEDYRCGVRDAKAKALVRLRNMRDGAVGERLNAYNWAIETVEAIR